MVLVAVVGGGYGGLFAAKSLEAAGFDVVLVERNEAFFHKIGGAKASVAPGYERAAVIPLDKLLKRPGSRLVWATATSLDPHNNFLTLEPEGVVEYDYLVLATGLRHGFGQLPERRLSRKDMLAWLQSEQRRVAAASRVTIVGGGALGVESAAQIRETRPETPVKLVHSRSALMSAATPAVSSELQTLLLDKLRRTHGVEVELDAGRVDPATISAAAADTSADDHLVLWTAGCKPPTGAGADLVPLAWRDADSGEVVVEASLHVAGAPRNVFAIGDVAGTKDYKQARWAFRHAAVVTENVRRLAAASGGDVELREYHPQTRNSWVARPASYLVFPWVYARVPHSAATVSLYLGGNGDGVIQFQGIVFNDRFAKRMLHKDKGAGAVWQRLGVAQGAGDSPREAESGHDKRKSAAALVVAPHQSA